MQRFITQKLTKFVIKPLTFERKTGNPVDKYSDKQIQKLTDCEKD